MKYKEKYLKAIALLTKVALESYRYNQDRVVRMNISVRDEIDTFLRECRLTPASVDDATAKVENPVCLPEELASNIEWQESHRR